MANLAFAILDDTGDLEWNFEVIKLLFRTEYSCSKVLVITLERFSLSLSGRRPCPVAHICVFQ